MQGIISTSTGWISAFCMFLHPAYVVLHDVFASLCWECRRDKKTPVGRFLQLPLFQTHGPRCDWSVEVAGWYILLLFLFSWFVSQVGTVTHCPQIPKLAQTFLVALMTQEAAHPSASLRLLWKVKLRVRNLINNMQLHADLAVNFHMKNPKYEFHTEHTFTLILANYYLQWFPLIYFIIGV